MNQIDSLLTRARSHRHQLIEMEEVAAVIHGRGAIANVNKWLAVKITKVVGTMWCAYVFAALAIVSLPAAIESRSPVTIVQWISTVFLQLVLLSIIIVGQNVIQEASDQRAEADHETLQLLHQINVTQLEILQVIKGCVDPEQGGTPASGA